MSDKAKANEDTLFIDEGMGALNRLRNACAESGIQIGAVNRLAPCRIDDGQSAHGAPGTFIQVELYVPWAAWSSSLPQTPPSISAVTVFLSKEAVEALTDAMTHAGYRISGPK